VDPFAVIIIGIIGGMLVGLVLLGLPHLALGCADARLEADAHSRAGVPERDR
jgi:hypothetical protein